MSNNSSKRKMISIAADYLIPEKMTYFPFKKKTINDLFISRQK